MVKVGDSIPSIELVEGDAGSKVNLANSWVQASSSVFQLHSVRSPVIELPSMKQEGIGITSPRIPKVG